MGEFCHRGDQLVHHGHLWDVVVAEFQAPDGRVFRRDVVRSRGAVAAVPVLFDDHGDPTVVLVRQYRPAPDRWLLEIPAGVRDVPGEPDQATAHRELIEEVGLRAGCLERLTECAPSPGMTDSTVAIYLATELTPVERVTHGPEEEHLEVVHLRLDDALAMIDRGELVDAKTIIGLVLAERRLRCHGAVDRG